MKEKINHRKEAMRATHLDWDRELCKKSCREWIPWYRRKKGKMVYGCRLGVIPEKRDGDGIADISSQERKE